MDIPVNKWEKSKKYQVNDIVEVGNLSIPESGGDRDASGNLIIPLASDSDKEITREDEFIISVEASDDAVISSNSEIRVGSLFSVNPQLGYSIRTMVRKGTDISNTTDPYKTFIKEEESPDQPGLYIINPNASIGVGAGIKFFDSTGSELGVTDLRNTHRLMASSELSDKEYYNVQLDIASSDIPSAAVKASLVVFVYGIKTGYFVFKQVSATSLSRFFYCIKDNTSSLSNEPNAVAGAEYWTQDFVWRPAYNSKADFVAINEKLQLGEGSDYVTNLAINSLPMQLNLQFDNRTDKEARAIVHFLEEKFFPYESVFALDYRGNRLLSSDVGYFSFKYTYPYREDLKFTCTKFNQTKTYRNNNNISATFICNTESILRSYAGHAGYNDRTDALIPLSVESSMALKKGQKYTLNTFSLAEDAVEDVTETATSLTRYPEDLEQPIEGGLITFSEATDLVVGDCINVRVWQPESSRFNVGLTRVTKKISSHQIVFSPILDQGSVSNVEGPLLPIGIEDGSWIRSDIFQQDPADGGSNYTALYESLDLTELESGWYDSSWFFKTAQAEVSGISWYFTPTSKWAYTNALGGQWIYLEPDGVNQLWFWQESIGWNFCSATSFAGNRAITYNAVADSAIGAVGWVEWFNPTSPSYDSQVYNYTDGKWYDVDLGVPQQVVDPEGGDTPVEPPLPTPSLEAVSILAVTDPNPTIPKTFKIEKLDRCPSDCLSSKPLLPDQVSTIVADPVDPTTGERKGSQLYLKNYRKIQIDSDITGETGTVTFTALEDFTLEKGFTQVLIPTVQGESSIYLKDANQFTKYPWLKIRNLDHKPSIAFSLAQSPSHIQSNFVEYYNHSFKKGINQNLSTFNVVFDKRTDKEAAQILQFLEAHLGCKKFRFQMPRPYIKDDSYLTTQSRPYMSTFYCPSWGHDVVYKNNHTITATFIESATSKEEDLRSVFGIGGREEEKPCVGAEIYDPITNHDLCTFSSALEMAPGKGMDLVDGKPSIVPKAKAVDLVFIVDGSGSMTTRYLSAGGTRISKFAASLDMVLKMLVAYDSYIMPGTQAYGGVDAGGFNAPPIEMGEINGDASIPPWPARGDLGAAIQNLESLIQTLYNPLDPSTPMRSLLETNDYNVENLERFRIKIDQKRVNISLVLMGSPGYHSVIDLSTYPTAFDKLQAFKSVKAAMGWRSFGENYPQAISIALAQLYNSPRAQQVTDRLIIMLSDGVTTNDGSENGSVANSYNPAALKMCAALRKDGELAKRRPKDSVLKQYGYGSYNPFAFMQDYSREERADGVSALINPDKGSENPAWYEESLPTVFMFASVGVRGAISRYAKNYAYDYDGAAPYLAAPTKPLQFYFPITDGGVSSEELTRMIDLIKVVEILTTDSGYQNVLSFTVHNCGPHDVTLVNSLINVKSQTTPLKWTTEILKGGIPKGGNASELEFSQSTEGLGNIKLGYGGQYYGDTKNQNLFSAADTASNILWESFNTKYEVYRAGVATTINGGWAANSSVTQGVKNLGVAFKGMPIRVFKCDSGLEITDYNIGNANLSNNYKGDYSHLPVLKPGEQLDLFFGIKANSLHNFGDEVQIVINSDDGTRKKMDCFGNIEFTVTMPGFEETAPSEDLAPPAPVPAEADVPVEVTPEPDEEEIPEVPPSVVTPPGGEVPVTITPVETPEPDPEARAQGGPCSCLNDGSPCSKPEYGQAKYNYAGIEKAGQRIGGFVVDENGCLRERDVENTSGGLINRGYMGGGGFMLRF